MRKLTLALTASTALAGTAALAQEETLQIGAAVYGLNAEFMQLWAEAAESHPAVESGEVELTIYDGRYDALVQQEQFETMITQGFDAIVFVPIDIEAGATPVQQASDAGIPVIGSNTRVNSDLLTSYVGSDDVQSGRMEAEYVLEQIGCDEAAGVVIIEGPIGQSAQTQRLEGNQMALSECPNVEVLERQTANWSRAEAQTLMENWLTSYPDAIDGVIAQNDEMALGAIEAIRAAGLDVGDFAIAGIDGVTDALTATQEGLMSTILQDAVGQAQGAIDVAINAARGGGYEPQAAVWADLEWGDGTGTLYEVPWTPVTSENVTDLLEMRQ